MQYVGFCMGYGSKPSVKMGHFGVISQCRIEYRIWSIYGLNTAKRSTYKVKKWLNYDIVQKSQFHPDWPPPLFSSWCSELHGATYLSFRERKSHNWGKNAVSDVSLKNGGEKVADTSFYLAPIDRRWLLSFPDCAHKCVKPSLVCSLFFCFKQNVSLFRIFPQLFVFWVSNRCSHYCKVTECLLL